MSLQPHTCICQVLKLNSNLNSKVAALPATSAGAENFPHCEGHSLAAPGKLQESNVAP